MTICIAALCNNSKKVVVASDRMLTTEMLSLQFEHPTSKIIELTSKCVIMTAGAGLRATELMNILKKDVSSLSLNTIPEIVDKVKTAYQTERLKKVEEHFLKPRGYTLDEYKANSRMMMPEIALMLDDQLAKYDYEVELIIAGVDASGGHVYRITNPGMSECFDILGYHQMGSGEPHAAQCFIENYYSPKESLQNAIWTVYLGKKRAENAPGVGKDGNFAIVDDEGIKYLNGTFIGALEKIRQENIKKNGFVFKKEIEPKLKNISF